MNLKITKIIVLIENSGPDELFLYTELPEAGWPFKGNLSLKTSVAADKGLEYCKEHFPGVELEIISRKRGVIDESQC